MKVLVGAVASALLFVGGALAQTAAVTPLASQCGVIAPPPAIPDGARASATQMHALDTAYRAWSAETEAKLHCRAAEIQAADEQVKAATAEFQAQTANARGVEEAYDASITTFNGRGAQARPGEHRQGAIQSSHK